MDRRSFLGTAAGYVKPGLESVRDTLADNARLMGTGGAAFAATHHGEIVVDLWAGMADHDRPWIRNTRVHVQSTSKAVTAATAMVLVDRGELDLDAQVGYYWPEYATNGKENTTVRMLLSHAAGSTRLPGYTELLDLDGNGFDQYDEIARRPGRRRTGLGAWNRACLSRLHVRQPGERGRLPGHRQARGRVPARRDGRAVAAEHLAGHARRGTARPCRDQAHGPRRPRTRR